MQKLRSHVTSSWLNDRRGVSLVMVLVALGLTAILSALFTEMLLSQTKGQKLLSQKFEILDLKQNILTAFQNSDACRCTLRPNLAVLADPANKKFNAVAWDNPMTSADESAAFELAQIKTGCDAASPNLVTAGAPLPGTQTGLVVDKIRLTHLMPIEPTQPANLRLEWQGVWEISFVEGASSYSLKPLHVTQRLRLIHDPVDSPEAARKFDTCYNGSDLSPSGLRVFTVVGLTNWIVPAGVGKVTIEVWGGGGGGGGDDGDGGAGGGGGGYAKKKFDVVPGETLSVTVGGGGNGGASGGGCGVDGGNSMVTRGALNLITANGGSAGCGASGGGGGASQTVGADIRIGGSGAGWYVLDGGFGGGGGGRGGPTNVANPCGPGSGGSQPGGGGGGGHHVLPAGPPCGGSKGASGQVVIGW